MQYLVQPLTGNSMSHPGYTFNQTKEYALAPHNTGLALTASGTLLEEHPWTAAATQRWKFEHAENGAFFRIISAANGKVVDIEGESGKDGAKLILADKRPPAWSQMWKLIYLSSSRFRIESRWTGKVWDMGGGKSPKHLIQWYSHGGDHQQFRCSEILDLSQVTSYGGTVDLYAGESYTGKKLTLPLGSHSLIALGYNDMLRSIKVPRGLRITVWDHGDATGLIGQYTADTPTLGTGNGKASNVFVELVASFHEHGDYKGKTAIFGVGNYRRDDLVKAGLPDNTLSSVRVPAGVEVVVFQDGGFEGQRRIITSDTPMLTDFNDLTSSIQVKAIGTIIPASALRYGDIVVLRSHHDRVLSAATGQSAVNTSASDVPEARFKVIRAGNTTTNDYVCYGDAIALSRGDGTSTRYLSARSKSNPIVLDASRVTEQEQFVLLRFGGDTQSNVFVAKKDRIALFSMAQKRYACALPASNVLSSAEKPDKWETWTIEKILRGGSEVRGADLYEIPDVDYFALRQGRGPAIRPEDSIVLRAVDENLEMHSPRMVCGADACAVDSCKTQNDLGTVCGANACAVALCGGNEQIFTVCGAAAQVIAICGKDVAFASVCAVQGNLVAVCGAAACAAAACGVQGCGGDACGAAACAGQGCAIAGCGGNACGAAGCAAQGCAVAGCGAAACGLQGCVADGCAAQGCGGNACAVATCPVAGCGAQGCGGDACSVAATPCAAQACGAAVCAINLCPVDACAARACPINIIPIIPFI